MPARMAPASRRSTCSYATACSALFPWVEALSHQPDAEARTDPEGSLDHRRQLLRADRWRPRHGFARSAAVTSRHGLPQRRHLESIKVIADCAGDGTCGNRRPVIVQIGTRRTGSIPHSLTRSDRIWASRFCSTTKTKSWSGDKARDIPVEWRSAQPQPIEVAAALLQNLGGFVHCGRG